MESSNFQVPDKFFPDCGKHPKIKAMFVCRLILKECTANGISIFHCVDCHDLHDHHMMTLKKLSSTIAALVMQTDNEIKEAFGPVIIKVSEHTPLLEYLDKFLASLGQQALLLE